MIIWKKQSLVLSQTDYQSIHEPCMYGWLDNGTHNWFGDRKQTSVWEYSRKSIDGHTTPKPIELVGNALLNSSKVGHLVIDLFGGSGSTLIAAEQLDRKCYMMELDEKYIDVIINRYANYNMKYGNNKSIKLIRDGIEHDYLDIFGGAE
jgi:DNA modification methylase